MRAAIYARVSSATQRDRHTIESQLRDAPAYATAQGWTVAATYIDDGRSAKAGRLEARDGYARMIRDAKAGAFEVVVAGQRRPPVTFAFAPRCRWWSPPEPTHNNGPRPAWDPECPVGEPGPHRVDVGGKRRSGARL